MAKPFDKKPNDYLKLLRTKELIAELNSFSSATTENRSGDNQVVTLVITESGGTEAGGSTWLHEDLAFV